MSTFQDDRSPLLKSIGGIVVGAIGFAVALVLSLAFGGFWFIGALVAGVCWYYWRKRARAASGTATSPVGSAHGYTEIFGKAEASAQGLLRDPVTDEPCVWFAIETERRRESSRGRAYTWDEVKRASSSREFLLRDASGVCEVVPAGGQFEIKEPRIVQAGDELRHRVYRICAGDPVYVLGEFQVGARRIVKPDGRVFIISDRPPREIENELSNKAAGFGLGFVVLVIIVVIVMLTACSSGDGEHVTSRPMENAISARMSTAQLVKEGRDLETLLGEEDRAERWQKELVAWAVLKRERGATEQTRQANELRGNQAKIRQLREDLVMIADLRKRGAYGPRGAIPDMLEVMDEQKTMVVGNKSNRPLTVRVTRSGTFPRRTETFWCVTYGKRNGEMKYQGVRLEPKESELFSTSEYTPCHFIEETAIEFEVRDERGLVWANEAVLNRLEQYAREDLEKLEEKVPATEAVLETGDASR